MDPIFCLRSVPRTVFQKNEHILIIAHISFSGAFEDEDVTHVEGDVNPIRDLEIIHEELRLKDEEYIV